MKRIINIVLLFALMIILSGCEEQSSMLIVNSASGGVVNASGTVGSIPQFETNTSLGDSVIRQSSEEQIIINSTNFYGLNITDSDLLITGTTQSFMTVRSTNTNTYSGIEVVNDNINNKAAFLMWGTTFSGNSMGVPVANSVEFRSLNSPMIIGTGQNFNLTIGTVGKKVLTIDTNQNVLFANLTGTGNAYACFDSDGKLYRSNTTCV